MKETEINKNYIIPSYSRYLDHDFPKLILDYKIIELAIANKIKEIIISYFTSNNFKTNGQRFFKPKYSFLFFPEFIESERLLSLIFRDDSSFKTNKYEIKVEHFGAIRYILFEFPEYLTPYIAEISSIISRYIFAEYTSLENAFITKCEHLADSICKRINSILINHLISVGKKHLIESTRFFIFQKDSGFFYFEKESFAMTIEHFKKNQSNLFSAYELLVWLLTNPLPFVKSLSSESFLNDNKVLWQEWDKSSFTDERKFYEAARKLYDFEPYAVLAVCRTKSEKFSLSVAFKKADKRDIVPELTKIKALIKNEFEAEVGKYSSFIKRIDLTKLGQNIMSNPYVYGEFMGHTLAAFFKGMNHLH